MVDVIRFSTTERSPVPVCLKSKQAALHHMGSTKNETILQSRHSLGRLTWSGIDLEQINLPIRVDHEIKSIVLKTVFNGRKDPKLCLVGSKEL